MTSTSKRSRRSRRRSAARRSGESRPAAKRETMGHAPVHRSRWHRRGVPAHRDGSPARVHGRHPRQPTGRPAPIARRTAAPARPARRRGSVRGSPCCVGCWSVCRGRRRRGSVGWPGAPSRRWSPGCDQPGWPAGRWPAWSPRCWPACRPLLLAVAAPVGRGPGHRPGLAARGAGARRCSACCGPCRRRTTRRTWPHWPRVAAAGSPRWSVPRSAGRRRRRPRRRRDRPGRTVAAAAGRARRAWRRCCRGCWVGALGGADWRRCSPPRPRPRVGWLAAASDAAVLRPLAPGVAVLRGTPPRAGPGLSCWSAAWSPAWPWLLLAAGVGQSGASCPRCSCCRRLGFALAALGRRGRRPPPTRPGRRPGRPATGWLVGARRARAAGLRRPGGDHRSCWPAPGTCRSGSRRRRWRRLAVAVCSASGTPCCSPGPARRAPPAGGRGAAAARRCWPASAWCTSGPASRACTASGCSWCSGEQADLTGVPRRAPGRPAGTPARPRSYQRLVDTAERTQAALRRELDRLRPGLHAVLPGQRGRGGRRPGGAGLARRPVRCGPGAGQPAAAPAAGRRAAPAPAAPRRRRPVRSGTFS